MSGCRFLRQFDWAAFPVVLLRRSGFSGWALWFFLVPTLLALLIDKRTLECSELGFNAGTSEPERINTGRTDG
ncbi:hypothetical protein BGP_3169 [Beggiatoa sp. PS]|nr:hypothetical protein BGP_3169 [Beggiatoa sp. PS]